MMLIFVKNADFIKSDMESADDLFGLLLKKHCAIIKKEHLTTAVLVSLLLHPYFTPKNKKWLEIAVERSFFLPC